jgi:hypothetical protein
MAIYTPRWPHDQLHQQRTQLPALPYNSAPKGCGNEAAGRGSRQQRAGEWVSSKGIRERQRRMPVVAVRCSRQPHLATEIPHLNGDTAFCHLAHVKAHLEDREGGGRQRIRRAEHSNTGTLQKARCHATTSIRLTVGIISSWNDPVVSTFTSELLPAFCSPISDSSISRLKKKLFSGSLRQRSQVN